MKLRTLILCAGAVTLAPAQTVAQTSLADQKLEAEIDKAKLDLEAARLKMQLDQQTALNTSLAAIRGTTGGQASLEKPEATAEGLQLARRLYTGAASQLGDAVSHFPQGSVPIVMFGTAAPSTADWLAFDNVIDRLRTNLQTAIADWNRVKREVPPAQRSARGGAIAAAGAAATVVNAVTSVASLFRVDTAMAGVPLTANDQQVHSLLAKALVDQGFKVDGTGLDIAGQPVRVKQKMAGLESLYLVAHQLYHEQYLSDLAKVKKIDEMRPALVVAGKHLEVALADFESLQRTLYTPVNGVLPATIVERQAALAESPDRPIVYIRNHRAALTTMTRKGFLTTLGSSVPIYLNGAAEVDYLLVHRGEVRPGSILCSVPRTRITTISAASMTCARPLPAAPQRVVAQLSKDRAGAEGAFGASKD